MIKTIVKYAISILSDDDNMLIMYDGLGRKTVSLHELNTGEYFIRYYTDAYHMSMDYLNPYLHVTYVDLPDVGFLDDETLYHINITDYQGNIRVVDNLHQVQESNNYEPFGVEMQISDVSENIQPYKHQGKEYISTDHAKFHDHGARLADNLLGRWQTRDPLEEHDFWNSPYAYCANNPVRYIDDDGRFVKFAPGTTQEFKKHFTEAVQYLNKHDAGGMLKQLHQSKNTYYIKEKPYDPQRGSRFDTKDKTIHWTPDQGLLTDEIVHLSPTSILNHEIDHALQFDKNPKQQNKDKIRDDNNPYNNKEEQRVITGSEQVTAKKLGEIKQGEVTRTNHGGTLYRTTSVTSTEEKNPVVVTPKED